MECYYIVISSAHLSNGHFRNIKGVFRGPLSKNGTKTLDYAEKENTIAKALEDLKANFYCELCDKQYYKHQEFDNHINSYDHAHKQRLKELKQREFARNVASKSRKDEKKQEKALQRLHKLAELRKEAACAPGSGPMFRSTTVMVRDNFNNIPQCGLIDSVKKEQDFNFALLHSSKATSDVASVVPLIPETPTNSGPDIKLGDQVQGLHGHKVGFSFAFPKKASIKLESSAAAFYEYNDETSTEHGVSRRSRFVPGPGNLPVSSTEEIALSFEEKPISIAPLMEKHEVDNAESIPAQDSNGPPTEGNGIQPSPELRHPVSHLKGHGFVDSDSCGTEVDSAALPDEMLTKGPLGSQTLPVECSGNEPMGNKSVVLPVNEEHLSQHNPQEENDPNISNDSVTSEVEIKECIPDGPIPANSEEEIRTLPNKQIPSKSLCEPFVPVLNKHGYTVLQWPCEMLLYTNTEPSISYSCNPLCFDFRSSKSSESLEKNKQQSNIPNSTQKIEASQDLDCNHPNESLSKNTDCAAAAPISSTESCNLEKKQDELSLDPSQSTGKNETHQNILKSADEQENKGWNKRTHEKRCYRNRKRKRRRKQCYHHYEEMTEFTAKISPVTEQRFTEIDKHQKLHSTLEQGVNESQLGDSVLEQLEEADKIPEKEDNDYPGTISIITHVHRNQGPQTICNTNDNRNCCINSNHLWTKSKPISQRQSNKAGSNSGKCNSVYSRPLCNWTATRQCSSTDHKHLSHYPDKKYTSQSQPTKRAYNSVIDEPERSHRKRRYPTHSYSSDESSAAQTCFSEENFRQLDKLVVSCKPKRKRRRKRIRIHDIFIERRPGKNISVRSSTEVVKFEDSPNKLTEENPEQMSSHSSADYAKSIENKMQPVGSQTDSPSEHLVSSENIQDSNCPISEHTPCLKEPTYSVSPVIEHSISTPGKSKDVLEGQKQKNENAPEIQASLKMSTFERNPNQSPPKGFLCPDEVAETPPQEKRNPSANEWLRYGPDILNSMPPMHLKETHMNSHAFLTTEQILTPFAFPEHALLLPNENHDKFKDLQLEAYHQIIQQNMLASKMKLTFPPAALQPSGAPLPPLPLQQQPLCSTSVTMIHHTVLQQHAAAAAAAAAATATTFKVLQPHQQFLSQVPALSRVPLPHLSLGPRLCPTGHTAIVGPPQLPVIPASILHSSHLAFPPLPHTLFPSLLSPHPAVIPLQPLF
ncbi:zinc finger protein 804A isoform X1 [Crotalus tigris]|uniref:zinc finger protein 804A isoform X1 n=2 Tax=Crotalus tigris TaxID=88082 RepID=UPI00192F8C5B|nr:zinc finger protein 804A isoform X1 [Crotalus tigris]